MQKLGSVRGHDATLAKLAAAMMMEAMVEAVCVCVCTRRG